MLNDPKFNLNREYGLYIPKTRKGVYVHYYVYTAFLHSRHDSGSRRNTMGEWEGCLGRVQRRMQSKQHRQLSWAFGFVSPSIRQEAARSKGTYMIVLHTASTDTLFVSYSSHATFLASNIRVWERCRKSSKGCKLTQKCGSISAFIHIRVETDGLNSRSPSILRNITFSSIFPDSRTQNWVLKQLSGQKTSRCGRSSLAIAIFAITQNNIYARSRRLHYRYMVVQMVVRQVAQHP